MISSLYDKVFLSYDKILELFRINNITTKHGKEITHADLLKAITVIERKHPKCRWKSEKIRSKRHYILIEGYYWLVYVYFQKGKKQIDADIDFFIERIKQYEKLLKIESKNLFCNDIYQNELEEYFNRKRRSVEIAIKKMLEYNSKYRYLKDSKF